MDIPNLPTDNLYKFMALSGLVLFIFTFYIGTKNYIDLSKEIDQNKTELNLFYVDTLIANHRLLEEKEKKVIVIDYLYEKYTDVKKILTPKEYSEYIKLITEIKSKSDSDSTILVYNLIYSLALRNPELKPLYEEYKKICDEDFKWSIDYQKNNVNINEKLRVTHKKILQQFWYIIFFGIFGTAGALFH